MTALLNQDLQRYRSLIDQVAKELHELAIGTSSAELQQTVSDLRNRIHEPFMFVIAGEVKAGKSSFVNALLSTGKEICKVAPQPMTDTIQQIVYGETEETVVINDYLRKIYQPVEILREIAIVDTPGTNTIVDHHQEITERFVPASDLIVFVFEAKNPYRQSAWDFFDFIQTDWRKKVIFVLQQKDLMNESDLAVNIQGVRDQAIKKGIEAPFVFAVSAKMEQEGTPDSGFDPLRNYISQHITGGKAPVLKLENNVELCRTIYSRIDDGVQLRDQQFKADQIFRDDVRATLDHQENQSKKQVSLLVENLIAGYDRITSEKERELNSGLSFFSLLRRSVASIFTKESSAKNWLEGLTKELEGDLSKELHSKLENGVADVAESIQQMAHLLELKISNSKTILSNDHELFSDIAERRGRVLDDLKNTFQAFINKTENFTDDALFPDKKALSPALLSGGGIAVIGAILMSVTNLWVIDVTGGVLTALGLAFAGVSTSVKKRKIMKDFRTEIDKGRERLNNEISTHLLTYVEQIKEKLDANFQRFDQHLIKEKEQLDQLNKRMQTVDQQLVTLKSDLEVNSQ